MKCSAWISACLGAAILLSGRCVTSALAQTPAPSLPPATIADELTRQLEALAADSLRGRGTPSPEIDRTAAYVAAQFRRFGITAQGPESTIVRYPIPGQQHVDYASSTIELFLNGPRTLRNTQFLNEDGTTMFRTRTLNFSTDARVLSPSLSATLAESASEYPVVMSGGQTPTSAGNPDAVGKVVIYVPTTGTDSASRQSILDKLVATAEGVILVEDADSAKFAAEMAAARQRPRDYFHGPFQPGASPKRAWVVGVRDVTVAPWLLATGLDLAQVQGESTPTVRRLSGAYIFLGVKPDSVAGTTPTAPNVVGKIPGSDSTFDKQWVVISAPLAACGAHADSAVTDSCRHTSLAALLALASAFGRPESQPRRSILLLATSGGPEGGWGSAAFADGQSPTSTAIHLDLDGRPLTDTVVVDGTGDVSGSLKPRMIAATVPDLRLTVRDGPSAFETATEAAAFTRVGMPTLVVHPSDDGHGPKRGSPSDSATSLVQVLDLVYALGHAFAMTDAPLRLSPAGRAQFLQIQRLP